MNEITVTLTFTDEELVLIKDVMNVFEMLHSGYANSDKDDEISEAIWEKLDDAGVLDVSEILQDNFENSFEYALRKESNDDATYELEAIQKRIKKFLKNS